MKAWPRRGAARLAMRASSVVHMGLPPHLPFGHPPRGGEEEKRPGCSSKLGPHPLTRAVRIGPGSP
jgi:hypothetical protein